MKYLLTSIYLLSFLTAQAQLHDNMWLYDNVNSLFHVDFRENHPFISQKPKYLDIRTSQTNFCDKNGDLLFYTNCKQINNNLDSLVENGDSLNLGYTHNGGLSPIQYGSFFLPAPGDSTKCYLVYVRPEYYPGLSVYQIRLQYALIDMVANNGQGKVLEKEITILDGGLSPNFLHPNAVRHANGRDWWILVPNRMEPKYYRILLTPQGFSQPETQEIGFKVPTTNPYTYYGVSRFSPDGTKFAELAHYQATLTFYDFDRCTGLLSNPVLYQLPVSPTLGDIAFSPSGKKLYLSYYNTTGDYLVQYDMNAVDFLGSGQTLLECISPISNYDCSTGTLVLAPNGKIYIGALIDTVAFNVINKPDNLGVSCGFELGGLPFPGIYPQTLGASFPNFRLGPVDGSTCDTLGINNEPVAWFFWEADELKADFSNASYHEPDTYNWDFGDGDTSTEVNPLHDYPAPGTYTACLTASNTYGSHTFCRQVTVDTLPDPVLPVPAFTWDAVELEVSFTNNSSNSPDSFLWEFGDGDTSTEANPVHTYPAPDSYNTCLTASNADGSNTLCQLVTVDTLLNGVANKHGFTSLNVVVYPNPAAGKVNITISRPISQSAIWRLYDQLGRRVNEVGLSIGQQAAIVKLESLPPGLYFWNMNSMEGLSLSKGKLVIVK